MTKEEWQRHVHEIYLRYPSFTMEEHHTLNRVLYLLRTDKDVKDYNISIPLGDGRNLNIPSLHECFVPVWALQREVTEIEFCDVDYGFDGVCLTIYIK